MKNVEVCGYDACDNTAKYYDLMHNPVCEDCMEVDVRYHGEDPNDYEEIEDTVNLPRCQNQN